MTYIPTYFVVYKFKMKRCTERQEVYALERPEYITYVSFIFKLWIIYLGWILDTKLYNKDEQQEGESGKNSRW